MLTYFKRLVAVECNLCFPRRVIFQIFLRPASEEQHKMASTKRLAAFDFDSTIICDNSDTVVRNLLPQELIARCKEHSASGWTEYMQSIFEMLHSQNIGKAEITETINKISPIDGMCELIKEFSEDLNFDVIIISDSNSYFINTWLKKHKLVNNIQKVFTNPAEFVDNLLKIEMYHVQDYCSLSTVNLCKGQILEDYIKLQKESGVTYSQLVYVGDGLNDFCPILRLNPGDLACCREGFKCADLVENAKEGKPFRNEFYEVKADVLIWRSGFDILSTVKKIL